MKEFDLIDWIRESPQQFHDSVIRSIGDDCAVLTYSRDKHLLVTTDMMVENEHFFTDWQTPFQIGMKLVESNVSDIVCKGGIPKFVFLSMCLTKDTRCEFVEELYRGIYTSSEKHGLMLVGGDTIHGGLLVFNLSLLGEVESELFRPRSAARAGDVIGVTGTLGGNAAGLALLQKGIKGYTKDYLEPKSRLSSEGRTICRYAHATIDVSDGLASEVTHIARESGLGAVIDYKKIPCSKTTVLAAREVGRDPADFALYGGEDFEIVFSIPGDKVPLLKNEFRDFTVVGEMVEKAKGISLLKNGKNQPLKRGYDHFS